MRNVARLYILEWLGRGLVAQMVKNLPAVWETWAWSLGGEDPLEEGFGNPLQYSYLENPHGQTSRAGYSPWGHKESDMTKQPSPARMSNIMMEFVFLRALSVIIF